MFIIRNKKIFIGISAAAALLSAVFIFMWGLNLGIDFTGGSVVEVRYPSSVPEKTAVEEVVVSIVDGGFSVRPIGENSYIIRTPFLEDETRVELLGALSIDGAPVEQERFSSVGPVIGEELKQKALIAISVVIVAIILFVAYAFRHSSENLSSWNFGIVAIVALIHDVLVPVGMYALLGQFLGFEVDILFVTALLAILGYSVNDTIVVFDRIRENLKHNKEFRERETFEETVGKSLQQSFARSLNTSLTTIAVLIALYIIGGSTTQSFALTLLIGVIAGTYSSIFLASPLLVFVERRKRKS